MQKDIYIAYRKDKDFELAYLIYKILVESGYAVSFDFGDKQERLKDGPIEPQIHARIDECEDFIIILNNDTFSRNKVDESERDWLKLEIEYAEQQNKHIIPILTNETKISKGKLPKEISFLSGLQAIIYSRDYALEFFDRLKKCLHSNNNITTKIKKHLNIREFLCYIAGADYDILRQLSSNYNISYELIGLLVCLQTLLALLTGGYAIFTISGIWWFSLCFAPLYAFIIFCSCRNIVATGATHVMSWSKFLFGLSFAVIIGLFISVPMEMIMFRENINEYVVILHKEKAREIQQPFSTKLQQLKSELDEIDRLQQEYDNAVLNAQETLYSETIGVGKSGKAGRGPVYFSLKERLDDAKQCAKEFSDRTLERRKQIYKELSNIDSLMNQQYDLMKTINSNNNFITQYKAFKALVANEEEIKMMAGLIGVLFMMINITPLITKMLLGDDNEYERLSKMIGEYKLKQYLNDRLRF